MDSRPSHALDVTPTRIRPSLTLPPSARSEVGHVPSWPSAPCVYAPLRGELAVLVLGLWCCVTLARRRGAVLGAVHLAATGSGTASGVPAFCGAAAGRHCPIVAYTHVLNCLHGACVRQFALRIAAPLCEFRTLGGLASSRLPGSTLVGMPPYLWDDTSDTLGRSTNYEGSTPHTTFAHPDALRRPLDNPDPTQAHLTHLGRMA